MRLEQNDEWFLNRCRMQYEDLRSPREPAPTRLSAVAR